MEIPVAFPAVEASPRRYVVVNQQDGAPVAASIRPYTNNSTTTPATTRSRSPYFTSCEQETQYYRGGASLSSLRSGIGVPNAVLTTSFVDASSSTAESARVLSVSLLPTQAQNGGTTQATATTTIQLDITSETNLGQLVRVQAVYWNRLENPRSTIALVLVDAAAVVVRVELDATTLAPVTTTTSATTTSACSIWNVGQLVATRIGGESSSNSSSASVHASMVLILSATRIVVALNPFLLAVDLGGTRQVTMAVWSRSKCMEDMKRRESKLFHPGRAVDWFIGKPAALAGGTMTIVVDDTNLDGDSDNASSRHFVLDMHPVSALCLTDNDPHRLFSLHSDGSVRHWTLAPEFYQQHGENLEPWQVCDVDVQPPSLIPPNACWNADDPYCVQMTSRMYEHDIHTTFALAIYIRAAVVTNNNNASSNSVLTPRRSSMGSTTSVVVQPSNNNMSTTGHLIVVDGPPIQHAAERSTHAVRLVVPPAAESMLSMSFDPRQVRCSLVALFWQQQQEQQGAMSGVSCCQHVTYPPSNLSMVSQQGIVGILGIDTTTTGSGGATALQLLDVLALQERERLLQLDLLEGRRLGSMELANTPSLDEQVTALDRCYLQHLFRPTWQRGTGLAALPPAAVYIHRAIAQLLESSSSRQRRTTGGDRFYRHQDNRSLELQTLQAVHTLRQQRQKQQQQKKQQPPRSLVYGTPLKRFMGGSSMLSTKTPGTDMARADAQEFQQQHVTFYDSLVETPAPGDDDDDEPMTDAAAATDNNDTAAEQQQQQQVLQAHQECWKQLLLEIWNQEQAERTPLDMAIVPTTAADEGGHAMMVVRAGSVSILQPLPSGLDDDDEQQRNRKDLSILRLLDKVASKVLSTMTATARGQDFEGGDDGIGLGSADGGDDPSLAALEGTIWDLIARGALGVEGDIVGEILESFQTLVDNHQVMDSLEADDCARLAQAGNDLATLLRDDSMSSCLITQQQYDGLGGAFSSSTATTNHLPGGLSSQQRAAIASLAIRSVDLARETLLGRLLVLLAVPAANENAVNIVLRKYLHCVTALWTCAQRVKMRYLSSSSSSGMGDTSLRPVRLDLSPSASPPAKRLHMHDGSTASSSLNSILAANGVWDKTTAIDSLLIYLADKHPEALVSANGGGATSSLLSYTVRLANLAAASLLSFGGGGAHNLLEASAWGIQLPELAAIPPMSGDVTDDPRLALRLLGVTMAVPGNDDDEKARIVALRQNVFAECLLIASSSEQQGEKGAAMVAAAIELLKFTPDDLPTAMKHVKTVCHHLRGKPMHEKSLTEFIRNAIDQTPPENEQVVCQLWSSLFVTSTALHNWETAYEASTSTPDKDKRRDCQKRLVRSMVDAGALFELLDMCAIQNSDVGGEEHVGSLQNSTDLYEIAVETLTENSCRDMYSYLAVDPEPISDYSGALYALHVTQGQWKLAAEALEARYENARRALADGASGTDIGPEASMRRDTLIVQDLVLSALGCELAMKQVPGPESEFLARGTRELPSSLVLERKESGISEAPLTPEGPRFQTLQELSTRAVVAVALKKLFFDKLETSKTFALSAFAEPGTMDYSDFIDRLFAMGYYHEGLSAANAQSKLSVSKPSGRDLFEDALGLLLRVYLVPLSSKQLLPADRPTLSQIRSAIETTAGIPEKPSVLDFPSRGRKISALYGAAVQTGASALVHRLTVAYSSAESPVAVEVAKCMLTSGRLPAWLEQLLVHGDGSSSNEPGLFAKRPSGDSASYRGDPSALLSIYTKRGMYLDACRVVTSVLNNAVSLDGKTKAPSRVPEKGNIDFVPYDKIDLLWELIEIENKKGALGDKTQAAEIIAARNSVEEALVSHFELLKISEMGLASARALS